MSSGSVQGFSGGTTAQSVTVSMIIGSLADGMTFDQIKEQYPQLSDQDILASLAYAAEAVRQDVLLPLSG